MTQKCCSESLSPSVKLGIDLKDLGGSASAQALGQARQQAHDQFYRGLLAMKNRTVMLQKKAATAEAVKLPPGAATGIPIGPQVVQPEPAAIITAQMGTKGPGGIHRPGASVDWRHGIRPSRRRWRDIRCLLLTQGTGRLVRQARKGFGFAGASALGLDGRGWGLESPTRWARPEVRQHDAQPEQCKDYQLIVYVVRNHRIAPLPSDVKGQFYRIL
jgi:hypothetical protein